MPAAAAAGTTNAGQVRGPAESCCRCPNRAIHWLMPMILQGAKTLQPVCRSCTCFLNVSGVRATKQAVSRLLVLHYSMTWRTDSWYAMSFFLKFPARVLYFFHTNGTLAMCGILFSHQNEAVTTKSSLGSKVKSSSFVIYSRLIRISIIVWRVGNEALSEALLCTTNATFD